MQSNCSHKQILICQNRTCRKQGSVKVLETFQALSSPDLTVQGTGCLGKCGSGPMILILPEKVWCDRVDPKEIPRLIQQFI
ncbi:MAG: (2Fe-2S) ferredoxin domain-containing protein [Microcoleaceae cyanobacterium]